MIAAALCALVLGAPSPAAARVTVTVQIAYGAVVVGGVGIFIAVGGAWDLGFAGRALPTALLEVANGTVRPGIPLPALNLEPESTGADRAAPSVRFDLLRWRF